MNRVDVHAAIEEVLWDVEAGQTPPIALSRIKGFLEGQESETAKLRAALEAIDNLKPDDFKTGQNHLPPAFREVNVGAVMREIARIVNGVLHDTDEYGQPLPREGASDAAP